MFLDCANNFTKKLKLPGNAGFPCYFIYKVVISVSECVCLLTQENLVQLASNIDWGTSSNHGNNLSLLRPKFKNLSRAQIWLVPLKIVFNFSKFKPALN